MYVQQVNERLMNIGLSNRDISIPENWDRRGLPGWTYHSDAFLELEKKNIFGNHWQIACHVSDVPEPGDFLTLDICGERALIVRGKDEAVRAFHNMCRHRGSRVVGEEKGKLQGCLGLSVSRLGIQSGRNPSRRGPTPHLSRDGQARIRPEAGRKRKSGTAWFSSVSTRVRSQA